MQFRLFYNNFLTFNEIASFWAHFKDNFDSLQFVKSANFITYRIEIKIIQAIFVKQMVPQSWTKMYIFIYFFVNRNSQLYFSMFFSLFYPIQFICIQSGRQPSGLQSVRRGQSGQKRKFGPVRLWPQYFGMLMQYCSSTTLKKVRRSIANVTLAN